MMFRFEQIYEIHYFWQILDIFFEWCISLLILFFIFIFFMQNSVFRNLCRLTHFSHSSLYLCENKKTLPFAPQTQLHTNNLMKPRLGPWPKQPPTANKLWLSTKSKSVHTRTHWPAAGRKACSSCPLSLKLVAGLGPYCLANLQSHCHGCGGSEQWACRRRVRPLASVPFRGFAEEERQGCSPKSAWLARCWCIFMPVDPPMATGNSVPYVAERGFCSSTTLWPHGFSFLLNLLDGFCGCICPTEFLGTWPQLSVARQCSLMGCLVLVWDTLPAWKMRTPSCLSEFLTACKLW